jgi:hypothetical protein
VKAAAARRVAEEKARRRPGGDVQAVHDPIGELQLVMGRAKALEETLWRRLQDDAPDAPEVGAYTTALDRLHRVLVDFERLEERAVRLQEQQGQVIAAVLQVTLHQVLDRLQEVVPQELHSDVGRVMVQEASELLAGELRKAEVQGTNGH